MDPKVIFEDLQAKFGIDVVFDLHAEEKKDHNPWFFVKPDRIEEVARHLRDDPKLSCDYLECLSGVDWPDKQELHVVYHLFSLEQKHRVVMKVALPRDDAAVTTLSNVWSAANWQERECFDLLGVRFDGHPNLQRILLPEDWVGSPLRKDYKEAAEYHGIPTSRPDPLQLLASLMPKPAVEKKAPDGADKKPAAKAAAEKKPVAKADGEEPKAAAEKPADSAQASPKQEPSKGNGTAASADEPKEPKS